MGPKGIAVIEGLSLRPPGYLPHSGQATGSLSKIRRDKHSPFGSDTARLPGLPVSAGFVEGPTVRSPDQQN